MRSLQGQRGCICLPGLCLPYAEKEKEYRNRPPQLWLIAICGGFPDIRNYLEKGKIRDNMLIRRGILLFGQLICIVALISLFGMIEPIAEFNPYILITK